jgi:hypothetical protein
MGEVLLGSQPSGHATGPAATVYEIVSSWLLITTACSSENGEAARATFLRSSKLELLLMAALRHILQELRDLRARHSDLVCLLLKLCDRPLTFDCCVTYGDL